MNYQVDRQYTNQVIKIPIRTRNKARIVVRVRHYNKPYTYYFDAAPIIEGENMVTVKIPKMPPAVIMEVYNEANGNLQFDSSFQVGNISISQIRNVNFYIEKIKHPTVASFAVFSDEFAEQAGILSTQKSVYKSPDGKYTIHYVDVIRDDNGQEMKTPARINTNNGLIEIAKKYYINYTVPGRKAINWHEFSHVWMNEEQANEFEADKNAIKMYLSTGNPTCEAYTVFLRVFNGTPSSLNRARYDALNKYIRSFGSAMQKQIN